MSSVKPEFIDNAGVTVEKRCQVKAVTLPMLMREFALERIRLCKLDCEGSELDILRALADEQIRQLDAMVIEYHPEAYPVQELAALLLSWGTHQVSFAEDKYCERQILRAVANAALLGA